MNLPPDLPAKELPSWLRKQANELLALAATVEAALGPQAPAATASPSVFPARARPHSSPPVGQLMSPTAIGFAMDTIAEKIKATIALRGMRAPDLASHLNIDLARIEEVIGNPKYGLTNADRGWVKLKDPLEDFS